MQQRKPGTVTVTVTTPIYFIFHGLTPASDPGLTRQGRNRYCVPGNGARLCGRPSVTASIERLDFHVPVLQGEVALVEARVTSVGRTSMNVRVDMYREQPGTGVRTLCTSGAFHMVALGQDGRPTPVVPVR